MDYQTIMSLWYYDLENIMESYSNILEERENAEKKRAKEQGYNYNTSPKDLMNNAKSMIPKMPNLTIPKL